MFVRIAFSLICLLCCAPVSAQTVEEIYQRATRLFEARDLPGARAAFTRVRQLARSRYYLGRIALLEAKPAEAIQWLAPVAHLDPPVFDAAAQLSKAYFETGQLEKAQAAAERAIHDAPWDGGLHYRLGRIHQQAGRNDRARAEFAESVRLKTQDRESVQLLLECSRHLAAGDKDAALRDRQQLLDNQSLDPDVLVAAGVTFAQAGMQEESLQPFQEAVRRDPNFFQAQYNAGLALLKLGHAADAVSPLQAGLRLAPDSTDVNSALSLAYVLQGRYADAVPIVERWHRLQPGNPRASTMLALTYLRTGSPAKAIPVLRALTGDSQRDPKPHFLLIEALNAAEQQAAALPVAERAARLFPDLAQAHLAKAQQLARLGRYSDAGPEFERALQLAPGQLDSLLGMGEVQQKQGDYPASLQSYRSALAADPGNAAAILGVARSLLFLRKIAEAREVLESGIKNHPRDGRLHFELARVYSRLGERDLAAREARLVQELDAQEAKTP